MFKLLLKPSSVCPPNPMLHAMPTAPYRLLFPILQGNAKHWPFLSLSQSCRESHVVSASPCVSQEDSLSFKFYGSYLWLKYHLWHFPSAKLQEWYSFIAKGCYWGPKWEAKSRVESECTWIPSHRKLSLFEMCPFPGPKLPRERVKAPKCKASWLRPPMSEQREAPVLLQPVLVNSVSYSEQENRKPASSVILWQL